LTPRLRKARAIAASPTPCHPGGGSFEGENIAINGASKLKAWKNCMRKHGDKLTNACMRAGEVSQAEVDRRKKELGR
jgi:hypothetical protein